MIVLAGGDLVLPDRILAGASLIIDGGRIAAVESGRVEPSGATIIDARGCSVAPGFIDVHVHGVDGHDTLDSGEALASIAAALPRYGVTSFSPTTVACAPDVLARTLDAVRAARAARASHASRVLPAHLESNFINPRFSGAQPSTCLRVPFRRETGHEGSFSGPEILDLITARRSDIGIVTVAPEIEGGLELVRRLSDSGQLVSLGHSAADFDVACAAIDAGARQATHLFNRMPSLSHRAPGLAGAVLARRELAAELVCDGFHVHPAIANLAIAAKSAERVMAITDGTAGAGLPPGTTARLGGRTIHVRSNAAFLDDGTLAGSTLTMDAAFRTVVRTFGRSMVEAGLMCATTPARELGLEGFGVLTRDAMADVVVLDGDLRVTRTFVEGRQVFGATTDEQSSRR